MVHGRVDYRDVPGGGHDESALLPVRDAVRSAAFRDDGVVVFARDAGGAGVGWYRWIVHRDCWFYDVFNHQGRVRLVARCAVCLVSALRRGGWRVARVDQWRAGASAESAFVDRDYWHAVFVSRIAADVCGHAVFY